MSTQLFSKFKRPEQPRRGIVTERDLDIIEAILRYRLSPTSELVRLVGGNEDVTQRRLRCLWEWGHINRFAFPGIRTHSEFIYYLDRPHTLELLVEHGRLAEIHPQMKGEVELNREAGYADAAVSAQHMKLGFLRHALMISRLHFMLEMASRHSDGQVLLEGWHQGAELRGPKVNVPEIKARRIEGSNDYVWEEQAKTQRLPVEPDAFFTLRFPARPSENQLSHFCYEADRGSMPMADMRTKLRAYRHFIKQQLHVEAFGVHPIRAVLIETPDESRARKLMDLAQEPVVMGNNKRSGLFWFIISPLFCVPVTDSDVGKQSASYLLRPELVLERLWATPDLTLHALGDRENSKIADCEVAT